MARNNKNFIQWSGHCDRSLATRETGLQGDAELHIHELFLRNHVVIDLHASYPNLSGDLVRSAGS